MTTTNNSKETTIDCSAEAPLPTKFGGRPWRVEKHRVSEPMIWIPERQTDALYQVPAQKAGRNRGVPGSILEKTMEQKHSLNANVLDFLIQNPHLIPDSWKEKTVFFWGTIYRNHQSIRAVRDLIWSPEESTWKDIYRIIAEKGHRFYKQDFAALAA